MFLKHREVHRIGASTSTRTILRDEKLQMQNHGIESLAFPRKAGPEDESDDDMRAF